MLFGAGLGAGLMNSLAGGGSFLTFPALVFAGVPSISANASSTVAVFPGTFASAWAYRDDLKGLEEIPLKAAFFASIAGGTAGALLLLYTSQKAFDAIVPWLLLAATIMFAFGPKITKTIRTGAWIGPKTLVVLQFFVAIYGGYFGGAVGIVMLGLWSLIGLTDIHAMNASRTFLGGAMNAAAVVLFVVARKVWWAQTAVMLAGTVIGGYAGPRLAKRINPARVRLGIMVLSIVITLIFFSRNS